MLSKFYRERFPKSVFFRFKVAGGLKVKKFSFDEMIRTLKENEELERGKEYTMDELIDIFKKYE